MDEWEGIEKDLHNCKCGCPSVAVYAEEDGSGRRFAECCYCGEQGESSRERADVVNSWNLRGGPCSECDGTCDEPEDDLCAECWNKGTSRDTANAANQPCSNSK